MSSIQQEKLKVIADEIRELLEISDAIVPNQFVEKIRDVWFDGFDKGYVEGENDGCLAGKDAGYKEGHDAGYKEGHEAGYEEGYQEGLDTGYSEGYFAGSGGLQ